MMRPLIAPMISVAAVLTAHASSSGGPAQEAKVTEDLTVAGQVAGDMTAALSSRCGAKGSAASRRFAASARGAFAGTECQVYLTANPYSRPGTFDAPATACNEGGAVGARRAGFALRVEGRPAWPAKSRNITVNVGKASRTVDADLVRPDGSAPVRASGRWRSN